MFAFLAINDVSHGNPLCVGTQAVALVSHGRLTNVVIDDGKEELGSCKKLASARKFILERHILVTDKQEEHTKMLKVTGTLSPRASQLQTLTRQSDLACIRQEEEQHLNGRS